MKHNESIFKGTLSQFIAVISGSLAAINDGMHYGWSAPIVPILLKPDSPIKITKSDGEWLETSYMIGGFLGLWISMYLVDKIGRKKSILLTTFVSLLIWTVLSFKPRVEYVYAVRAVAGAVGNMTFMAVPMYIAEIAEHKIRGFLSGLINLLMLFGIIMVYTIVPYSPFFVHCVVGICVACLQLVSFPFVPESPYYLLYKDQPKKAEKVFKWFRLQGMDISEELEDVKNAVARQKTEKGNIKDLFIVPSNRKAFLIMAIINSAQHFAGLTVLVMNLHVVLEAAGSIYLQSELSAILFPVMMLISAAAASFSIDKYGRKTLLILSSISTSVCLVTIAVYFSLKNSGYNTVPVSWIPTVCVMLYACSFKLGLGMVPIVLTAELFPAKMKAYGMALADGFYTGSSILSLIVYQRLTDIFGIQYPFYLFSFICIFTSLFTYFYIPETKGKSLEDIQMILKGKYVDSNKQPQVDNEAQVKAT